MDRSKSMGNEQAACASPTWPCKRYSARDTLVVISRALRPPQDQGVSETLSIVSRRQTRRRRFAVFANRSHFFAASAEAIRRVLVDHSRHWAFARAWLAADLARE